jgi:hypothetical protein
MSLSSLSSSSSFSSALRAGLRPGDFVLYELYELDELSTATGGCP